MRTTEGSVSVDGITAEWRRHPLLQVGPTVWRLHLCGSTLIDGDCFLHVAAVGPSIRRTTLFLGARQPLTALDLSHAIAARLGAGDADDGFDIMSAVPGS